MESQFSEEGAFYRDGLDGPGKAVGSGRRFLETGLLNMGARQGQGGDEGVGVEDLRQNGCMEKAAVEGDGAGPCGWGGHASVRGATLPGVKACEGYFRGMLGDAAVGAEHSRGDGGRAAADGGLFSSSAAVSHRL